jgi:hypothetical protein
MASGLPEVIAKEGFLQKKNVSHGWFSSAYTRRYFTVSDQALSYYESNGGEMMVSESAVAAGQRGRGTVLGWPDSF